MEPGNNPTSHHSAAPTIGARRCGPVSPTPAASVRLRPIGLEDVVLAQGSELGDWQQRNSAKTIPHCIEQLFSFGAVANLEHVAEGRGPGLPHRGLHFTDSDVYKILEAIAWDSVRGTSRSVRVFVDDLSALIARAQRQDGYINSWFQAQHPELIWKDLRWGHELYCAGHLFQGAVAGSRTGSDAGLSNVAGKFLEHILDTFSLVDGDGRLVGVCGHPEVETALVELYRLAGDSRALQLAKRYVDLRGRADVGLPTTGLLGDSRFPLSYFLHHQPLRERVKATGHAVRELYLQAGVVDVAVETNDTELLAASETIWEDLYRTKTYLTGAHGSRHRDESIGDAFELPNDRAYAETCAAIASFQWNWRLLLATGRARYAEAMERVFWNTIAGAVSREGTEFFYSNTLHLRTGHDGSDEDAPSGRLQWYWCPCCPPNLARLMASIQTYLVTTDRSGVQVHMPFTGTLSTQVPGGTVDLNVRSGHPWDGDLGIEVTRCSSGQPWELSLRRPEWATAGLQVRANGEPVDASQEGSYIKLSSRWHEGDRVDVAAQVPVRVINPSRRVDASRGCVAVERGPLVYCLEADDLRAGGGEGAHFLDDGGGAHIAVEDLAIDLAVHPTAVEDVPSGLEGYVKVALRASGEHVDAAVAKLYDELPSGAMQSPLSLTLVPYFSRGNRPAAGMRVWVPTASKNEAQ